MPGEGLPGAGERAWHTGVCLSVRLSGGLSVCLRGGCPPGSRTRRQPGLGLRAPSCVWSLSYGNGNEGKLTRPFVTLQGDQCLTQG